MYLRTRDLPYRARCTVKATSARERVIGLPRQWQGAAVTPPHTRTPGVCLRWRRTARDASSDAMDRKLLSKHIDSYIADSQRELGAAKNGDVV